MFHLKMGRGEDLHFGDPLTLQCRIIGGGPNNWGGRISKTYLIIGGVRNNWGGLSIFENRYYIHNITNWQIVHYYCIYM